MQTEQAQCVVLPLKQSNTDCADCSTVPVLCLLEQQISLYHELKTLAERQLAAIASREMKQMMLVMRQRRQVIERMTAVSQKLQLFEDLLAGPRPDLTDEQRQQVDQALAQMRDLLHQVLAMDERGREALGRQRDELGRQIAEADQTGKALRAYDKPLAQTPRFLDRAG